MRTINVKSLFTKKEFVKVELLNSKRDGRERYIIFNMKSTMKEGTMVRKIINLSVLENYNFEKGLPAKSKGGCWTVQK